jgi:UDP-glucose 4-epimerase
MTDKRVVLITGVSGYWGGQVAAKLAGHPDWHVIGFDTEPPAEEIKGLDFIQADIRNPMFPELLKEERVDTVAHLVFQENLAPSEASFDLNVMGTMKVLGACAEAGVRKVILKSSALVYGARPMNSAFLREDAPLQGSRSYGYVRDLVEIEAFCNGFRGQNPDLVLTILRFANIVGPKVRTPFTKFLKEEEAIVLLGFDPMMQVIHEADVVGALDYAVREDLPGIYNVAAEVPMPLWRILGLAGKMPIPVVHPAAYMLVSSFGKKYAPLDLDYLRYPCVSDLRRMREEMRFVPQYTGPEALREFASHQRKRQVPINADTQEENLLRDVIERRRRAREREAEAHKPSLPTMTETTPADKPKKRRTSRRAASPEFESIPVITDNGNGHGAYTEEENNG